MKRLILSALIALGFYGVQANAIMLTLSTDSYDVSGGPGFVDIGISGLEEGGLDEIVAAFSFDLLYDPSLVVIGLVEFGDPVAGIDYLDDPLFGPCCSFYSSFDDLAGTLWLDGLSLVPDDDLALAQPDTFTLVRVNFDVLEDEGFAGFELYTNLDEFLDVKGRDNTPIVPTASVPEPGILTLLGTGLLMLVGLRRRRLSVVRGT